MTALCAEGCVDAPEMGTGWVRHGIGRGCPECGTYIYSSAHVFDPGTPVTVQHGDNPEHRRQFVAHSGSEFVRIQVEWFREIHSN